MIPTTSSTANLLGVKSFSTTTFRRGYSGLLNEVSLSDVGTTGLQHGNALRLHGDAALYGKSDARDDEGIHLQRVEFPTIPYYGVLRGFVLEVPQQQQGSLLFRRLFPLLEQWSRQGGGQSWRFGATWGDRLQSSSATQIRLLADDAAQHQQQPSHPTAGLPPSPSTTGSRRSVNGATPHNKIWYGEYVEALSDAMHQFFSFGKDAQQCFTHAATNAASATAAPPPPTLYVELRRHSRWRDVSVMLCYEGGVANMYVATSHRTTQRFITQRAEEVDVAVEWINGATLVSSGAASPQPQPSDTKEVVVGRRRPRERVDPCRVLAEIVLNLDLLTTLTSTTNPTSVGPAPPMPSPQLPVSSEVAITTSFPFLHGAWQCHRVRPQDVSGDRRSSSALSTHYFVSTSCADGAMEVPLLNGQGAGEVGGVEAHHLCGMLVSAKCVSCFTRGAPLLGPSLQTLIAVLIDVAKLDAFTLRFQPWQQFRAAASSASAKRENTAIGIGLSVVGRDNALRRSGGPGGTSAVVVLTTQAQSGEPSNGLCYSRLSTTSWLQEAERAVVAANAAGGSASENDEDDAYDDVEAEFYPLMIQYKRDTLLNGSDSAFGGGGVATTTTGRWGASFLIENAITLMFGGDV